VRSWRELFADAYRAEDAHLVRVARGDEQPQAGVRDGVAALEAALAVNRSLRDGLPVRVAGMPEGSGEPQGGAPVDPEGSGEPQGGAPVR
jgi:hypothetical protein